MLSLEKALSNIADGLNNIADAMNRQTGFMSAGNDAQDPKTKAEDPAPAEKPKTKAEKAKEAKAAKAKSAKEARSTLPTADSVKDLVSRAAKIVGRDPVVDALETYSADGRKFEAIEADDYPPLIADLEALIAEHEGSGDEDEEDLV